MLGLLLAAQVVSTPPLPDCRRGQLSIGAAPREGVADYAPVSGMVVSIRNHGRDCSLTALPSISLLDSHGRALSARRRVPPGLHPGPVVPPIGLPGGHRATFELTWPYCSEGRRCVRLGGVSAGLGAFVIRGPVNPSLPPAPRAPFQFNQPPGRVAEGMASDLD